MINKKVRIQFVDTDASGRIHYSSIFRYFEIMDHHFFREIGYPCKELYEKFVMPRVNVHCDYLGTIAFDDELDVQTSIAKVGSSSFTYLFKFFKETDLVAKGGITIVFLDPSTEKSVPIPDYIKDELIKHLETPVTA